MKAEMIHTAVLPYENGDMTKKTLDLWMSMVDICMFHGVYKPTYDLRGQHIVVENVQGI